VVNSLIYEISGFRREVEENFALLGYYLACSDNFLPTMGKTYRSHLQVSRFSR